MPFALFILFGLVAVGTAAYVVIARNPINSAISLVVSLFSLACVYVLLEAHFLAVIQVLVYAGAIMVLFLFVVMLLDLTPAELGPRRITPARVLAGVLVTGLAGALITWIATRPHPELAAGAADETIRETWSGGTVTAVGSLLFQDYLLPFEIASVLLLIAIIGAVVIAQRRS